jgi:hypothetical protein
MKKFCLPHLKQIFVLHIHIFEASSYNKYILSFWIFVLSVFKFILTLAIFAAIVRTYMEGVEGEKATLPPSPLVSHMENSCNQ